MTQLNGRKNTGEIVDQAPSLSFRLACLWDTDVYFMSSGLGVNGTEGRCYPFWREYKECLKKSAVTEREPCFLIRDDYKECLYRREEVGLAYMGCDVCLTRFVLVETLE